MSEENTIPQVKQLSRPVHKGLNANLEGTVELDKVRVDLKPDELKLGEHPIRPSKWKPKRRYAGTMKLQFAWPDGVSEASRLTVSVASVHRPKKADRPHLETACAYNKLEHAVEFDDIQAGDYAVVVQPEGFRPYVSFVKFTRRSKEINLASPLHPVTSPEQGKELLRMGELHPYIEITKRYLGRLGYFSQEACECSPEKLCEHTSHALRRFQRVFRLDTTGSLTVETFLLMQQPRCPHPDFFTTDELLESSAGPPGIGAEDPIAYTGNRWDSFSLRYRLFTGTGDISNEWSLIRSAMNRWADVSPLSFAETSGSSDLEFDFRRPGESGYPFDEGGDKDGNTLAHAWGPTNGTVEFDDHEDWGSTSLPAVATHEIGHALGLAHSSVDDATMYPWYDSGWTSLHEVDVRGIKSLYAPVYRHSGPFVVYPLYAFGTKEGTDSVTIDLGRTRHFLAWGTITMIDSLIDLDRDNMCFMDIYEVDGNRTGWRVSGGDHFGSSNSPGNVYEGAYVGYGRTITFRITSGHHSDLEASGFAIVLVLD